MRKAQIAQHRRWAVIATKGPKQFSCHNQIWRNILVEVWVLLLHSEAHRA